MQQSTLPEISMVPGYYTHCDLKQNGKLSRTDQLLRSLDLCILNDLNILKAGNFLRNILYLVLRIVQTV